MCAMYNAQWEVNRPGSGVTLRSLNGSEMLQVRGDVVEELFLRVIWYIKLEAMGSEGACDGDWMSGDDFLVLTLSRDGAG